MKSLVFDSSSIISLAMNDLLWTLKPLRASFEGSFVIPQSVEKEVVEVPFHSHRFKFEAIMVRKVIEDGDLAVHEPVDVDALLFSINRIFSARASPIQIVNRAEVEALVLAVRLGAGAYVVDERTMRLLVEHPERLRRILESKLHTHVHMDKKGLRNFHSFVKEVNILRSAELMMIAVEEGLLENFMGKVTSKEDLVDALLWGLRLRGCAISTEEIEELKKLEA